MNIIEGHSCHIFKHGDCFLSYDRLTWGHLWGYSSGSAGGSVTPRSLPGGGTPALEPTETETQPCEPPPRVSPDDTRPEPAQAVPAVADAAMDAMEKKLVEQMHARMDELEQKMMKDLHERKRKAEENLDDEMGRKKQFLQQEIDTLMEQRSEEESRLALVAEQLQDKMLCVSEEQTVLDDLKAKSQIMQQKLDEAAASTPEVKEGGDDPKVKQKEALRLKLMNAQAMQSQVPSTPKVPPPTPSGSPACSVQSTSPGGEVVPVSSQRFTSSTHPEAWQYLYRLTRSRDKCGDEEIYKAWHEGCGLPMQSQCLVLHALLLFHPWNSTFPLK